MNHQQYAIELERRLVELEEENVNMNGRAPGAPSFEAYRERLGFIQGLIAARNIVEELNSDIRKGEMGDKFAI